MEQAIKKLMEIEATARGIMHEAAQNKKWLSEQMEQSCREYDAALDAEIEEKIQEIRSTLEKETSSQLTELKKKTEKTLENLDLYYAQNHERLSQELFKKILQY